jgi:hypothetical protein
LCDLMMAWLFPAETCSCLTVTIFRSCVN